MIDLNYLYNLYKTASGDFGFQVYGPCTVFVDVGESKSKILEIPAVISSTDSDDAEDEVFILEEGSEAVLYMKELNKYHNCVIHKEHQDGYNYEHFAQMLEDWGWDVLDGKRRVVISKLNRLIENLDYNQLNSIVKIVEKNYPKKNYHKWKSNK